ncbi:hypothetical protein J5N97_014866 [Dioscorea zingiberensis]|uniref:SRR1-like domain-containing protein n=1 Tax=Dioscorea zingiberensis TaxID=325984 RepID=A0A9D5CVG5_9LILI|nr:hypothetical protein J5N97_014866 [Dioscorea zingiberensis]
MSAPPNPYPNAGWTIVSHRRHRGCRPSNPNPEMEALNVDPVPPSPWTPMDPCTSPELESKILCKIKSTIHQLKNSRFYARVLDRLRCAEIQSSICRALSPASGLPMVIYGIGRLASDDFPRIQLALALLLREELPITSIEVFDPVLSASECAVLKTLGLTVLVENEMGRRVVSAPTLFFLPHCDAALYDNLLSANWEPARLNSIVLLGNSFEAYAHYLSWAGEHYGSEKPRVMARHVMAVRQYVREVAMEERQEEWKTRHNGNRKKDEESVLESALWDTSWHFFELEDGANMDILQK